MRNPRPETLQSPAPGTTSPYHPSVPGSRGKSEGSHRAGAASRGTGDSAPGPASSPPPGSDDAALLHAWRHGDREAIATLLRGYQARVYAVCYRMLRSADEASDLTQESLVRILEGLHTYDGRSQLSTWIIRVTMNCCLSYLRKQRLRRHGSLDAPPQRRGPASSGSFRAISGPVARELEGPDRVEQTELREALQRALLRLDPGMRAMLVLRDMQDLDYQQIADVLGVPVGTVKSRLFRSRLALRELTLEELGDGAEWYESGGGSPSSIASLRAAEGPADRPRSSRPRPEPD